MSRIASILDRKPDAELFLKLQKERKDFFNRTYIDSKTGKTCFRGKLIDTQASYILPLAFNLLDSNTAALCRKNLQPIIARENKADNGIVTPTYSLMTGFIGTAWISNILSDNGYAEVAYRLFFNKSPLRMLHDALLIDILFFCYVL